MVGINKLVLFAETVLQLIKKLSEKIVSPCQIYSPFQICRLTLVINILENTLGIVD